MTWTKEKEARYHELFAKDRDFNDSVEYVRLDGERNAWVAQQLEKQGPTRAKQMDDRDYLQQMSKAVHDRLPDNWGFIVFAFEFGSREGRRMRYSSNARREDAIATLKEWLIKASGPADWLKHIE